MAAAAVFSSSEQRQSSADDVLAEEDSRTRMMPLVVANGTAEPPRRERRRESEADDDDDDDAAGTRGEPQSSSPSSPSRSPSPNRQQQQPPPNNIPPMETVLYNLHCKCCHFALRQTNRWWRCRLEELLLVLSVCGFVALLQLHVTFLHVIPYTCLPTIPHISFNVETTHLILIDDIDGDEEHSRWGSFATRRPWVEEISEDEEGARSCEHLPPGLDGDDRDHVDECRSTALGPFKGEQSLYFTYSKHPGWFLRQQHQRLHGGGGNNDREDSSPSSSASKVVQQQQESQREQYVYISKHDIQCFGEPFMQRLVFFLLTPDTVMINWLIGAFGSNDGYVYNPRSGKEIALNVHHQHHHHHGRHHHATTTGHDRRKHQSSHKYLFDYFWSSHYGDVWRWIARKCSIVAKTTFLFFVTTTLVSFTLRETQGRMLHFTHHLLQHVRSNRPVVNLVVKHVAENVVFVPIMVGIIFFLTEFYRDDKLLAFLVLTLLWICESFSVVSLRTVYGIQYFPRTFFLLFAAFHFYYFSYPHGFAYAALTTAILFMVHSMLFFWHRYELPAVCRGQVVQHQQIHGRSQSWSPAASPVRHFRSSSTTNTNTTTSHGDGMMAISTIGHQHHNNINNDSSHDRSLLFGLNGEVIMRPSESFLNMQESALQAIVGAGTSSNDLRQPALFLS